MSATYTKLKSGDWGIRVEGSKPSEGSTITVTKKSGESKTETIAKVIWSGNGVHLCAIKSTKSSYTPTAGGSNRNVCAECGRGGRLVEDLEDGIMKHYGCCDIPSGY